MTRFKFPNFRHQFNYIENSKEIEKKNFKKLMNSLNKPLFTMEEQLSNRELKVNEGLKWMNKKKQIRY